MLIFGVICLALNAVAHLLQVLQIRQDANAPANAAAGVGAFVVINTIAAVLNLAGIGWALWLGLIFPLLGGLALAATLQSSPGSRQISYAILVLDLLCVLTFGYLLFLA
ncbi:MAG: hypothetical protein AAF614_21750 [Chloroflexota bacterium]